MPLPERSSINFGPNVQSERYRAPESLPGLFAQFDRGAISLAQFLRGVETLGFQQTPEFERLVSGNCTFTLVEVVKALKKGEKENVASARLSPKAATGSGSLRIGNLESGRLPPEACVFDVISAAARGAIDADDLRKFLINRNVDISAQLDKVLRLHASDNSQTFQDFAKVLKRQGVDVARPDYVPQSSASRASTPPVYCGESELSEAGVTPRPAHPTRGLKHFGNHGNFIAWN